MRKRKVNDRGMIKQASIKKCQNDVFLILVLLQPRCYGINIIIKTYAIILNNGIKRYELKIIKFTLD